MFEWISLRATAAAPGPSSHFMMIPASRATFEPWLLLKESSAFMPTFKDVTVSVPSVEASAQAAVHQAASPAPSSDLGTAWQFAASCSYGGGDAPWVQ